MMIRIMVLLMAMAGACSAQEWDWPEKPKNIQVLNKDWPGSRLAPIMKGFTRALGVRCSYCHVGEEGKPLSTYDFASDAKANKERAREMLRMLADINGHLKKLEPSGDRRVNMWCHTCHRGRPRPMTLEEELEEAYRSGGLKRSLEHYAELRKTFLDRGAYDFGDRSLDDFGHDLLEKDAADAIQVFKLNAEQFPQSARAWSSLGEGHLKAGNLKLAQEDCERALAIDPNNRDAKETLQGIKNK